MDWDSGFEEAFKKWGKFKVIREGNSLIIQGSDWVFSGSRNNFKPENNEFGKYWFLFLNYFRYYVWKNFEQGDREFRVDSIYEEFKKVDAPFHKDYLKSPKLWSRGFTEHYGFVGHSYIYNIRQIIGKGVGINKIVFRIKKYYCLKREVTVLKRPSDCPSIRYFLNDIGNKNTYYGDYAYFNCGIPVDYAYFAKRGYGDMDVITGSGGCVYSVFGMIEDSLTRYWSGNLLPFFVHATASATSHYVTNEPVIHTVDYTLKKCGSEFKKYGIGLSFSLKEMKNIFCSLSEFVKEDSLELREQKKIQLLYKELETKYLIKLEKKKKLNPNFDYEVKEYFNGLDIKLGIVIKEKGFFVNEIFITLDGIGEDILKNFDKLDFTIMFNEVYIGG